MTLNLKMDGKYESGSNQNEEPQASNSWEGRVDSNGSNNVASHKKIETKQHIFFNTSSEGNDPILVFLSVDDEYREEGVYKAEYNDQNPNQFDNLPHDAGNFD